MKHPLRYLFDGMSPLFEKNKLFRFFKPLFDATDAFFFSDDKVNHTAPFLRDGIDLKRFMMTVIYALVPAILGALYFFGPYVVAMILVSYISGAIIEIGFAVVRRHEINEGFLVSGMLLPLILPVTTPLWVVAVGMMFGVMFGKEIFGGTGHNPLNPALVGRAFIFLSWPNHVAPASWRKPMEWPAQIAPETWSNWHAWLTPPALTDATSGATPLGMAKAGDWADASAFHMFFGGVGGCIGETSAILIIIGGVFLMWTRVANWRSTVMCLIGAYVTAVFMHLLSPESFAPGWFHLLAGGFLFGSFFMVTDPVSGPVTNPARYVYGLLIGVLVVVGRNLSGFPEWVTFAILLMNLFAPLLDESVWAIRFRRLKKCQTQ